ncbi:MAG: PDZ domain-containing protein [Kiritimatiellaeota bacterium]|nr:PDZ domain-containing protein [Kiritimatiellota bacterium]
MRKTPTVNAVAKIMPSVVNIGTERIVSAPYSPWGPDTFAKLFDNFYERQAGRKEYSLGSGVIIAKEGLILTNSHVAYRATRIFVNTYDGQQYLAKEIAGDPLNDIALLKITNKKNGRFFKPVECARPGDLMLGETVVAVGNPYGLGNSITKGILSATKRKIAVGGKVVFSDIIQTDAPINPGNSGGPLININGRLIGINTAIFAKADGIGFAVPLKRIEDVLASWLIPERFGELSLGLVPGECVKNGESEIFVKNVIAGSPAERAGIKKNDVILRLNGKKQKSLLAIGRLLWKLKAGSKITFDIRKKGNIELTVEKLRFLDGGELASNKLGLGLQKLTPKLAKALNYPFHGALIVNKVAPRLTGIKRGDVLVRLGETPIYDFSDIRRAMKGKRYGDTVLAVFISIGVRDNSYYLEKHAKSILAQ